MCSDGPDAVQHEIFLQSHVDIDFLKLAVSAERYDNMPTLINNPVTDAYCQTKQQTGSARRIG